MPLAMDIVDTFDLKNQRPPQATFSTEAVPVMVPSSEPGISVPKLNEFGVPIYKDVDYVTVRQPGGTDSVIFEVEKWLNVHLPNEVQNGRLNPAFPPIYRKQYEAYKAGQEIPVEGTPLRLWSGATKAQIATLTAMNILTVEDLATLPDDSVRRIGMGGVTLKQRANAWLATAKDNGKANEMVALQQKNALLEANLATLAAQIEELKRTAKTEPAPTPLMDKSIDISDAFDEPPKRGKK